MYCILMNEINIKVNNISKKQWPLLLVELNMIKESWKPFAKLEIQTPGFEKIIKWGKKKHGDTSED